MKVDAERYIGAQGHLHGFTLDGLDDWARNAAVAIKAAAEKSGSDESAVGHDLAASSSLLDESAKDKILCYT